MMKLAILMVVSVITREVYGDEPEPIVGGQVASPGQLKHQVSIQQWGEHFCGGSIISEYHIVTAAHCIPDQRMWGGLTVVTGIVSLTEHGQTHKIKCIQVHPLYGNSYEIDNDIAVITVATPIISNDRQAPISLASQDYGTGGYLAIISGWGQTHVNEADTPNFLQWVSVKILNRPECMKKHPGAISQNQICTFESKGKGSCMGDSGGPLVIKNELVGVVSWGIPCAVGEPDVFTNVYTYRNFIQDCQSKSPTPTKCPWDSRVINIFNRRFISQILSNVFG